MRTTHKYVPVLLAIVVATCNQDHESNFAPSEEFYIPDHISDLENLTVYSPDIQPPDTVELVKEVVFESNEDVLMHGFISSLAVDTDDRVYIASTSPGSGGVYVFEPDGSFLTMLGRVGQGPGEFEVINSIDVRNGKLFVLDSRLQRVSIFSLDQYELAGEASIDRSELYDDGWAYTGGIYELSARNDGYILLQIQVTSPRNEDDIGKILYYAMTGDGLILPGRILEMERFSFYFPSESDGTWMPFTMPFSQGSQVSISGEGSFYTAWTDDFLIKEYDKEGQYVRAFYYPIVKSDLSLSDLEISDARQRVLRNYDLPDTWPALHTMEMDDEGRFWVATITESEDTFTWWVLDQEGQLLARFTMPGNRAYREVLTDPLIMIRNGYFYTRERDVRAGIERIVKYRVELNQW